ncbi:MAG: 3'-5' exonuclease [Ruthenibacterium lactatiformans]
MTLHGAKAWNSRRFSLWCMQRHIAVGDVRARAADLAEERRLFYVGITRARDELILTYRATSPFLAEIPSGAVTSGGAAPKALPEGEQLSVLRARMGNHRVRPIRPDAEGVCYYLVCMR